VIAPTLSGCAERAHILGPDVSLSTHVVDVAETLFFEDATDVVLVGHSYSGMVITGAAAAAGPRIRHLVYVDAYLPHDGESMLQLVAEPFRGLFATEPDGWRIAPPTAEELGVEDASDRAWADARLRHHTRTAYAEPLRLDGARPPHVPGTYVLCVPEAFGGMAARARAAGWTVHDLPGSHDPMITAPEALAGILDGCAADER
jgi:pimeloyl-ACP methyl ester carboxylesterase